MAAFRLRPLIRAILPTSISSDIPRPPRFTQLPALEQPIRSFHTTPASLSKGSSAGNKSKSAEKTKPAPGGAYARTDDAITVEYPTSGELSSSGLISGADRAGVNVLATFSLQGKVGVVTGGARGLGLVMGQGM
jgi:D-arabinitol 2-dehydrogenase